MTDKKTQSIQSRARLARNLAVAALMALLLVSCASTQMTANGKVNATANGQAIQEQRKTPSEPDTVETRLTELFGLCKSNDTEKAASYFVYRGPDKAREWKETLRADDPLEKGAVKELCQRINGYTDKNQGYSFGEVKVETESEGEWHALEVSFYHGSEQRKAVFAFLLINGQFSIGDIDD